MTIKPLGSTWLYRAYWKAQSYAQYNFEGKTFHVL